MKRVEYILDLAAPNGYLVWYPLRDLCLRHDADLTVTPVFLGGMHKLTGNSPPMFRDAEIKGKVEYAQLEFERFIEKHDLDRFRMHPALPFNSILLQRLLLTVDAEERLRMVEALQPAVWEANIDATDQTAVGSVLTEQGFDAEELLARTQDDAVKQRLVDNTQGAVNRGAFGIPTFFVTTTDHSEEMFFGKERLGQVEEMLTA